MTEERQLEVQIRCTQPPRAGSQGQGTLHIGLQKDTEVVALTSVASQPLVLRAQLRVRRHTDGTVNFLGPFAHGPRAARFLYLNWTLMENDAVIARPGRIKLHLAHLSWRDVEAAAKSGKPISVTLPLSRPDGKPVYASVRDGVHWDL